MRRLLRSRCGCSASWWPGGGSGWIYAGTEPNRSGLSPGADGIRIDPLSIGSVKLNHEELNKIRITGIVLMIIGILCLGLSEMSISATAVRSMRPTITRRSGWSFSLSACSPSH